MNAPRILVWFWSGGGGGSQFAARLAHRLTLRFGSGAVALSMRADDPTIATAQAYQVRVYPADIVSDRRRPLASAAGLMRAASVLADHARDVDVVIAAMNFATAAPVVLGLSKRLVYCAHDPAPHPGDYAARMQRWTQSALLRRADAIVALSNFAAGQLRHAGIAENKLRVAPLASVFAPKALPAESGDGVTRLLFLGRMIDYKGADILAEVLPLIAHRDDWRLTIAGHGPALTPALAARFNYKQVSSVKHRWLGEGEIDALLAQHDVMLAPYRSASQSGVVAEAMAAGLPCVVTPVGALVEQIGVGGWSAAAPDAAAFASTLTDVLNDAQARRAKAKVALNFAREEWEAPHWDWLASDWHQR